MKRLARTDLAIQTRQLARQAVWCGVVFGLATLITVLNVLPPIEVRYQVTSKVLVSHNSANSLQSQVDNKSPVDLDEPTLAAVQIIDKSSSDHPVALASARPLVLLGVNSLWKSACSADELVQWLSNLAASQHHEVSVDSSKELLVAQWQLEAAKHYQTQHEYLSSPEVGADRQVFQLASNSVPPEPTPSQVRRQLDAEVQGKQLRLAGLLHQHNEAGSAQEKVELTDEPVIAPFCAWIPSWLALSIIVLGIAAGASAGWLHLRLQSGGVYDPNDVAIQLSKMGIPHIATVQLSADQLDEADWIGSATHSASEASRLSGRNLILISEVILGFWTLAIVARLCADPLWRSVLFDSPLAALGRLISGMP
jgi:hypothetical protein